MADTLLEDLLDSLARRRVVTVVGAGISVAATGGNPLASWTGLLLHGVSRCEAVVPGLPTGWGDRVRGEIQSGDLDDLLSAAEKVTAKLGGPSGGEYARWLRETVGSLRVVHSEIIEALVDLEGPLVTTNYDDLLEEVTGLPAVTWLQGNRVERILRGDARGVIHLHGHWDEPESVILGVRSYEKVLGSEHAKTMLRAFRTDRTLVFIGFGAGMDDPHFEAFRAWSGEVFAGSDYRHYRLARRDEVEATRGQHAPEERIFVIPYGDRHGDLSGYLRSLRPPQASKIPTGPRYWWIAPSGTEPSGDS